VVDSFAPSFLGEVERCGEKLDGIKSFSSEAIVFKSALACSSHSDYEDLVILSGQHQLRRKGNFNIERMNHKSSHMLHKIFKSQGYETALFSSQNEFWRNMHYASDLSGWDILHHAGNVDVRQHKHCGKLPDLITIKKAEQWIYSRDKGVPFFMYVNLQDAHIPYSPMIESSVTSIEGRIMGLSKEIIPKVVDRYISSLQAIDNSIKRIMNSIESGCADSEPIVVITSDTGQAFGEHGYGAHGRDTFVESISVPLLLRTGERKGLEVSTLVSHVDIAPMLLQCANLPMCDYHQGYSLKEILGGERVGAFAVCLTPIGRQFCLRTDKKSTIFDSRRGCYFQFDRLNDASEMCEIEKGDDDSSRKILKKWINSQINYGEAGRVGPPPHDKLFSVKREEL
jgi:membrane-anchored protein YejM (alkaline phosphatase superfamily)